MECLFPEPLQFSERLEKRFSLWEYQNRLARDKILVQISHHFTKHSLRPIAPDRIPESFADDNPNPTGRIIHFVRHEIENSRRDSPALALHRFDVPASA